MYLLFLDPNNENPTPHHQSNVGGSFRRSHSSYPTISTLASILVAPSSVSDNPKLSNLTEVESGKTKKKNAYVYLFFICRESNSFIRLEQ